MFGLLNTLARALAGKATVLEFTLGIFLGFVLGLVPMLDVQDGTGWLGFNTTWLLLGLLLLLLRASLPLAMLALALGKLAGIAFLDGVSWSVGRWLLEGPLPQGFGEFCYGHMPSAQLHTYWGLGSLLVAPLVSLAATLPLHLYLQRKLPGWRERFANTMVVRGLKNSFLMKAMGWWFE